MVDFHWGPDVGDEVVRSEVDSCSGDDVDVDGWIECDRENDESFNPFRLKGDNFEVVSWDDMINELGLNLGLRKINNQKDT